MITRQLTVCPASALAPQLHIGQRPTREGIKPIDNSANRAFILKPGGGLWTSTANEEYGSEWVRWCRANEFGDPDRLDWWTLIPTTAQPVLVIDGWAAFDAALQDYGYPIYPDSPDLSHYHGLDFDAIARDYAGMHLTHQAAHDLHTGPGTNFNAWDCESTVWFSWVFDDPELMERKP